MRLKEGRRFVVAARVLLCLACVALLAVTTLAAQDAKAPASGKFNGSEWWFEASGAYAFPGEVGMDDEQGILVAISNAGFSERLDRIWDRRQAIDDYHVDEKTLVVYFHFDKAGKYKGMNYYFGSGDGCGFCYDGSVKSTVKVAKGRIAGRLSLPEKPDEQFFDITFDVPVAPSSYGTALPADGGEIGKLYAAYHKALDGTSPAPLRPMLDAGDQDLLKENPEQMMSDLREDHPTKSYKIVKGFVDGDAALLLVEGENSVMGVTTEVHFVKLEGTWRVYDELMKVRLGG